jgi:hypothetical protein
MYFNGLFTIYKNRLRAEASAKADGVDGRSPRFPLSVPRLLPAPCAISRSESSVLRPPNRHRTEVQKRECDRDHLLTHSSCQREQVRRKEPD